MQTAGITIAPPDINKSKFSFIPDVENNQIIYGIKGITRVGDDIVKNIIANRPYTSIEDFSKKVKVNKTQMINLIKSGAFDTFGDRVEIMKNYILSVADQKKRLTLQNMAMLIEKKLLPDTLNHEIAVYNFNKYLKKHKVGANYELDKFAFDFYEKHFDCDLVFVENNRQYILQTNWDKIYKKAMDPVRAYLKENGVPMLFKLNTTLFNEVWDKYCGGTISKWEMDSISFYNHEHELSVVNNSEYDFANFYDLPEDPIIDRMMNFKGKQVPMYKTFRFTGTVLGKDKNKGIVTLLTTDGVVSVRIFKTQFAEYDKQISQRQPDGTKKIIEKSWFSRGNKIIVNGFRRGNDIVLKKYRGCPYHILSLITNINDDGTLDYVSERLE